MKQHLLVAVALAMATHGCLQDEAICDCAHDLDLVTVKVAPSDVSSIVVNGPGCSMPEQVRQTSWQPGYTIWETGAGICHIEITFSNGDPKFVTDVQVVSNGLAPTDCCGGYQGVTVTPSAFMPDASSPGADATPDSGGD